MPTQLSYARLVAGDEVLTIKQVAAELGVPNTRAKSQADNFLSIRRMDDGTIEVGTPEIPVRARAELDQIAIVPNVTVTGTVSGTVIETNADETPGFFGGSYRWNISSWDDRVFLKVDPAVD